MTTIEIAAFNRGVRAVAALAEQVGGLLRTEVATTAGEDPDTALVLHRGMSEFAVQALTLLEPEPADDDEGEV